jgi:hypothetical protein
MCVTSNRYVNLALGVTLVAVTAGAAAPYVTAAYTTAFNIGVGAALGATTSAALGNDPLQGALLGGAAGGFLGFFPAGSVASQSALELAVAGNVAIGGAGAFGLDLITPKTPDYSQFGYGAQPYEPQGYSSQYAQVTGSGGRQAAAVLAEEIKKSRTLRQRQQEETTAYNVAGELASTGLQIA